MARTADSAAAMAIGAQANVEECRSGSRLMRAYASAVAAAAATGTTPPESPLPMSMMSGSTPSMSAPHMRPHLPNPVRISSSTSIAPYSSQAPRTSRRYPVAKYEYPVAAAFEIAAPVMTVNVTTLARHFAVAAEHLGERRTALVEVRAHEPDDVLDVELSFLVMGCHAHEHSFLHVSGAVLCEVHRLALGVRRQGTGHARPVRRMHRDRLRGRHQVGDLRGCDESDAAQ